ncbi:MAG TPA: histidine phosphatase family protein [Kiritimatiellia bacterium]|nr:histidine phosphatase family protein [Kiritimatiellia bacterium]
MRILFIRHAQAVEADQFDGDDLDRPLTPEGRKRFKRVADAVATVYPRPDRLVSSRAERACRTAEVLALAFGLKTWEEREELNPGASVAAIKAVLEERADAEWVMVVGHEPDFSGAVSALTGGGRLRMKLRKGGVAEVEWTPRGLGRLRALLDPARLQP